MTTANDSKLGSIPAAGGSTATPQGSSVQTFALKVQFNDDIRRIVLSDLDISPLIKKAAEVFKLREHHILLKYQDEEGDFITITTSEDLCDAHRLAAQRSAILRLVLTVKKRNEEREASSPVASPLTIKHQKEALKEQKKILKEQKKEIKLIEKEAKRQAKAGHFQPSTDGVAPSALPVEEKRWRDFTPEERMAHRMARRQANLEERQARCEAKRAVRRQATQERGERVRNKVIARFVKHVTIPDGAKLEPNQHFVKTWRMRNEGETDWVDCKLLFVSKKNGDLLGAASEEVIIASPVPAGSEIDISVNMVAPQQPGRYVGFWRLSNPDGRKFGQRIWVKVDVVSSSTSSSDEEETRSLEKLEDEIAASFVEIKDEKADKPKPTMAEMLRQLKELGFTEVGKNISLLKKHDGNINAVITELIA